MLKIHTKDGQTVTLDLADEAQARDWLRKSAAPAYQEAVTGLTLVEKHGTRAVCPSCGSKCSSQLGVQVSVSRPQAFRRVELSAERVQNDGAIKGGERALVFCDDVRLTVMAHAEQPAIRITVAKTGTRRYNPAGRV